MNAMKVHKFTAYFSGEITSIHRLENASNCLLFNEVKIHLLKDARKFYPRIIMYLFETFLSAEII